MAGKKVKTEVKGKPKSEIESELRAHDPRQATQLAAVIMHHKRLYYAGKPEISDAAYDKLEQELRELDPHHPALQYIGTEPTSTARRVAHDKPMLSLNKTYKVEDLLSWMGKEAIVGSPKVDGNSLSLIYEKGELKVAKTRGDGRVGEDVSEKVRWIAECPPRLDKPISCEVRGEIYCSTHAFAGLVTEMLKRGLERPTNPRNIVAGLLGRKVHFDLCHFFQFFAFDALGPEVDKVLKTETEKYAWLSQRGFQVLAHDLITDEESLLQFLETMRRRMAEDEIAYDGAVFAYERLALQQQLGSTSHHPRYKLSFKWPGQTAEAEIERIEWATSRLGIVTPVAVIKPVYLSGATITNITLHNAEHVSAYNLKAGDKIEIIRSGEVIPKFLQVITAKPGSYSWPRQCPSCLQTLEFDGVRLKCPNEDECPAQRAGFILNWIRAASIDDLSDKRLEQMVQAGLLEDLSDLYRLEVSDFLKLPATKEKMAQKLYDNIQKSRELPLAHFLNGMGIEGAGLRTWEKLIEHFHNLDTILAADAQTIAEIDGFAAKSAEQIVEGLKKRRSLIKKLLKVGVKPLLPKRRHAPGEGPLAGKQFVITGALSRSREEIEKLIRDAGGKASSSVSKNTFALVTGEPDSNSSKMKKAKELSIPIWTEEQLLSEIGD